MDASTNAAIAAGISKPPPAPGSEFRKDTIQSGPEPGFEHDESADLKKLPHVDGVDEFGGHRKVDPAEIALVRKLDRYMLVRLCLLLLRLRKLDTNIVLQPILWLMYLFNYLDRNAIVNARLNDLEEDLGLVGTQYNTCVSILFVG